MGILLVGGYINVFSQALFVQSNISDTLSEGKDLRMVTIDNIFITGNVKTKLKIILRELSIEKGKSYNYYELKEILKADRDKVFNTRLFNDVRVEMLELSYDRVDVVVQLDERWYLFPIPLLDFADRNFNDWWVNHNHDFGRLIYGMKLYHFNMRGMNERMTLTAQFGYSHQFSIDYEFPYIDKSQRLGLRFFVKYIENKNVHYNNIENKRVFLDSEKLLRTNWFTGVNLTRRNSFYTRHHLEFTFSNTHVVDSILTLNPNYNLNGSNTQNYFSLSYTFDQDKRDITAYPLKGFQMEVKVQKDGLGLFNDINKTSIRANYSRYVDLKKGWYFSNYSSVYLSTPKFQPYSVVKGLGFKNDVIRGYELFVIHGQDYYLNRTTIKKRILGGATKIKKIPIKQFQYFPYAIYLKTYADLGYARNTQRYEGNSFLADKLLVGTGIGVDFVTFYDMVFRFEYSINGEGQSGLFFSVENEF